MHIDDKFINLIISFAEFGGFIYRGDIYFGLSRIP
jgi:hypothetical protein